MRGNKNLTGLLTGVTAAGAGVILNPVLVFGAAVIFPNGVAGNIEWFAAVLSIAAFIAFYYFKTSVLWIVLIGGLIGLVRIFLFG